MASREAQVFHAQLFLNMHRCTISYMLCIFPIICKIVHASCESTAIIVFFDIFAKKRKLKSVLIYKQYIVITTFFVVGEL
jgi:hypothetical protein